MHSILEELGLIFTHVCVKLGFPIGYENLKVVYSFDISDRFIWEVPRSSA